MLDIATFISLGYHTTDWMDRKIVELAMLYLILLLPCGKGSNTTGIRSSNMKKEKRELTVYPERQFVSIIVT